LGRALRVLLDLRADVTTTFGIGTQEPSPSGTPLVVTSVQGALAMAWMTEALAETSANTA